MTKRQIITVIKESLNNSQYRDLYTRDGGCFYIYYRLDDCKVCPLNPQEHLLMIFEDQKKESTIVISTDSNRLPLREEEMSEEGVFVALSILNKMSSITRGIQYEAPFIHYLNPDINRVVIVSKNISVVPDKGIIKILPEAIGEVLEASHD